MHEKHLKILEMLSVKRPYDDRITKIWTIEHIMKPARAFGFKPLVDVKGNVIVRVGDGATTLFSCHTDTVHHNGGVQRLMYDPQDMLIWKADGQALGADDGAGVFILMRLMEAKIPGMYVFHVGEERGTLGSKYIASETPHILKPIKRAIAFDRRGTKSVITKMSPGVVCSKEFAEALAAAIDMGHVKDPTGSVTDTARYRDLVPECTNVSVGYHSEHGGNETLDAGYLYDLADHLVKVDFEALPVIRDPKATETYQHVGQHVSYSSGYSGYAGATGSWANTLPPLPANVKRVFVHTRLLLEYPNNEATNSLTDAAEEQHAQESQIEEAEEVEEDEPDSSMPSPVDDTEAFLGLLFGFLDLDVEWMENQFLWDAATEYIERHPDKAITFANDLELLHFEQKLKMLPDMK